MGAFKTFGSPILKRKEGSLCSGTNGRVSGPLEQHCSLDYSRTSSRGRSGKGEGLFLDLIRFPASATSQGLFPPLRPGPPEFLVQTRPAALRRLVPGALLRLPL